MSARALYFQSPVLDAGVLLAGIALGAAVWAAALDVSAVPTLGLLVSALMRFVAG